MITGVAPACFNAPGRSPTFVDICDEDFEDGDEDNCGELRVSMYGTRPIAPAWQRRHTEQSVNRWIKVTRASTCTMRHEPKDISTCTWRRLCVGE